MRITRFRFSIYSCLSILLLLLIWQVAASVGWIDKQLVPPPSDVAKAIVEWASSGLLWTDLSASLWRGLLGLCIGSAIGILLGLWTGRTPWISALLTPVLNVFKAFPPVAMLPIFITFFGIGDFSKVFSISFATVFPLWVNTHIGAQSIPVEFIRSAKLLSSSSTKTFLKVMLPASMNSIIAGLRISTSIGFIMLYVSELAGASSGLGYRIVSAQLSYRMDIMLGALLVLGLVASLTDYVINKAALYFFPWLRFNKIS